MFPTSTLTLHSAVVQTWDDAMVNVLTVATDRTHAGTGLNPGSIDVSGMQK